MDIGSYEVMNKELYTKIQVEENLLQAVKKRKLTADPFDISVS